MVYAPYFLSTPSSVDNHLQIPPVVNIWHRRVSWCQKLCVKATASSLLALNSFTDSGQDSRGRKRRRLTNKWNTKRKRTSAAVSYYQTVLMLCTAVLMQTNRPSTWISINVNIQKQNWSNEVNMLELKVLILPFTVEVLVCSGMCFWQK